MADTRNTWDPLFKVVLLNAEGHAYDNQSLYGRDCVTSEAEARKDYEEPYAPRIGWRDPISAVLMVKWNPREASWDELERRPAKQGEFQRK